MSEDLQMVLQMYREWKKDASGWIEQGAEQFFRGVPIRQLEEMDHKQTGDASGVSNGPLPGRYHLVKDKVLDQWWIMRDDTIVVPYAINDRDEAHSLALHFSKCDACRDVNTEVGKQ